MTALPTQNPGALPSSLLSTLSVAVSAFRQSVFVHHLLPLSLAPQSPREGDSGGGKGWEQGCRGRLNCGRRRWQRVQPYYGFHQSGRQVTARFTCVGQSRLRVCCKPARTGKVIGLVTATN